MSVLFGAAAAVCWQGGWHGVPVCDEWHRRQCLGSRLMASALAGRGSLNTLLAHTP